jgi:hypothetical protein
MSGPVMLPDFLRKPKPRLLRDVQVGEKVEISFTEMEVDEKGHCFLNPAAVLSERDPTAILIDRREDGYHVTIPRDFAQRVRWEPGRYGTRDHYPVASLTVEGAMPAKYTTVA